MERRYAFENEIMRAVELGIPIMETRLYNAFNDNYFENRASDPIRNIKNYSIIMNTLLRKAAEKAGVHPIHLDKLSSEIARNIEDFSSIAQTTELMSSIFNQYSSLVRNERTLGYSEVVKKTIVLIESDLSSNLSSSSLAEALGLSLGYISSLFKKEVGKCLSEYIREKRMKYACHLLETTNLQIQTVALHCGIMDLQYFSKLFKKTFGITPSEYRNQSFQKGKNNSAHK